MLGIGLNLVRPRFGTATTLSVNPIPALSPMMWLDASALSGFEEDDVVDTVPDSSGNANDGTQGVFIQMPIYKPAGINGKPGLSFDGVDDWLSIPIQSGIMQYFAVFRSNVTPANAYWGLIENGGIDNEFSRMGLFESGQTFFHNNRYPNAVRKNGTDLVSPFNVAPITTTMVLAVSPSAIDEGGTRDPWPRGIGCLGNLGYGNFTLAELVAFNAIQSAENTSAIEAHLARKYSITLP